MPRDKDLKRVVRTRMEKTGESYTTARSRVLAREKPGAAPADAPPRRDLARIAGVSDDAVKRATGCDWKRWVDWLDQRGADRLPHRDIARMISESLPVGGWWAQTVTVGYERIKGLRETGQRRGGDFDASKSKTFGVPVERLYRAFARKAERERWLDLDLKVTTSTKNRSVRFALADGTRAEAWFTAKGESKSQVQIQHRKLRSQGERERIKAFWGERLADLARTLA